MKKNTMESKQKVTESNYTLLGNSFGTIKLKSSSVI